MIQEQEKIIFLTKLFLLIILIICLFSVTDLAIHLKFIYSFKYNYLFK